MSVATIYFSIAIGLTVVFGLAAIFAGDREDRHAAISMAVISFAWPVVAAWFLVNALDWLVKAVRR